MNKVTTTAILFVFGLIYLLTALVTWEINIVHWSSFARFCFIGISISWMLGYYSKQKREKEFERIEKIQAERRRQSGGFGALLQKQLDTAEAARKKTNSN